MRIVTVLFEGYLSDEDEAAAGAGVEAAGAVGVLEVPVEDEAGLLSLDFGLGLP